MPFLVLALAVPALGRLARRATPAIVDVVLWLAEPNASFERSGPHAPAR